jgi:hypothetical protein
MNRMLRLAGLPIALASAACGWNPSRPFEREAPPVREAIEALDAGDAAAAAARLEDYLSTGACSEGSIGAPDTLKRLPDGTFDLGLALFRLAEQYGRRFGDEEIKEGADENVHAARHSQIECARRVLESLEAETLDPYLRARARYLEGNLSFLDGEYEDAVHAYDRALVLSPGLPDGGDAVGRDAAWNRAIAQRRIEDKKNDAGPDASHSPDASPGDSGRSDSSSGAGDAASGGDGGGGDRSPDAGPPPSPPPEPEAGAPDAAPPPRPSRSQDDRILDDFENAPTLQQEEAKRHKGSARGMVDK